MNTTELDFRAMLTILRERWRTVVLTTLLIAAVAAVISQTSDKAYSASTEVLINQPDAADRVATTNTRDIPPRVAANEVSFIEGDAVTGPVTQQFGETVTVSAEAAEEADLLVISVEAPTAERAQTGAIAAAELYQQLRADATAADYQNVAAEYDTLLADLDVELDALLLTDDAEARLLDRQSVLTQLRDEMTTAAALATGDVTIVKRPELPTDLSSPRTARNVVLATIAGLFLGIGLALLRSMLDQRARNSESVTLAVPDVAVLAEIPQRTRRGLRARTITTIEEPGTATVVGDAIRTLRAHVKLEMEQHGAATMLVVSPNPGDGKTAVAANLAIALARSGTRTVLIDAHAANPAVHDVFGLRNRVGLADVLDDNAALREAAATPINGIPLRVITSGDLAPRADLLASTMASELVSGLVELFPDAAIIIDGPPARSGSAALDLVRLVDTTFVVVDAAASSTADLQATIDRIEQIGGRVAGAILNRTHSNDHWYAATAARATSAAPALATGSPAPSAVITSETAAVTETVNFSSPDETADHADDVEANAWPRLVEDADAAQARLQTSSVSDAAR